MIELLFMAAIGGQEVAGSASLSRRPPWSPAQPVATPARARVLAERAQMGSVLGRAGPNCKCTVAIDGALVDCRKLDETPTDRGFGESALRAAADARIDVCARWGADRAAGSVSRSHSAGRPWTPSRAAAGVSADGRSRRRPRKRPRSGLGIGLQVLDELFSRSAPAESLLGVGAHVLDPVSPGISAQATFRSSSMTPAFEPGMMSMGPCAG